MTCALAGMKPHATGLGSIHITLFMTSQPADPRPDPFSDFGGQSVAYPLPGSDGQPGSASIPGPTPQVLAAEQRAFASLAAAMPPPTLEVPPSHLLPLVPSYLAPPVKRPRLLCHLVCQRSRTLPVCTDIWPPAIVL